MSPLYCICSRFHCWAGTVGVGEDVYSKQREGKCGRGGDLPGDIYCHVPCSCMIPCMRVCETEYST